MATFTPFTTNTVGNPTAMNMRLNELLTGINGIIGGSEILTSPTINDFGNAEHDHEDATGGGQLRLQALDASAYSDGTYNAVVTGGVVTLTEINSTDGFVVGDTKRSYKTTPEAGWLFADGKTIGSASSGATARANADCETLYTILWNGTSNTYFPIQDSSGTPTTRGASAAADFAANKRLPIPDHRGRTSTAPDNMNGTSANRMTGTEADSLGGTGGAETHTLTTPEIPAHTHSYNTGVYASNNQGSVAPPIGFDNSTTGATTGSAGGGGAHNNLQPFITENVFIKYK